MDEVTAQMIERGAGSDAAARRRRRESQRLREMRAQLAGGWQLPESWEHELLRAYARSRLGAAFAAFGMILAVTAIASIWRPWFLALAWALLTLSTLGVVLALCRRCERNPPVAGQAPAWRMRLMAAEALHGLAWAALLLLTDDQAAQPFRLLALVVASGMTAMMAAPLQPAVIAGLAPLLGAVVLSAPFTLGFQGVAMPAFAMAAQLYFAVLSRRLYANAVEGLTTRGDREDLIAQLEQAKANSDEARRRSDEANLAKSRFLATMSHELRTPLNAILGFSEVMKEELFGAHSVPAYKDYATDIHASGRHLLELINEILDLSRVEAGRYELKEEAISLGYLVEECQHLLEMRSRAKSILVSVAVAADLPRVWADERAIRQIVINLLSNAVKFTPPGGEVVIKVGWTASGGQYVSIRDDGPGIPEEEIPTVMDSFGRGAAALKKAEEGSGLGLPIVKGLVELHGGVFMLKSRVREGTEAIMLLPPERVMEVLAPMPAEENPIDRKTRAA